MKLNTCSCQLHSTPPLTLYIFYCSNIKPTSILSLAELKQSSMSYFFLLFYCDYEDDIFLIAPKGEPQQVRVEYLDLTAFQLSWKSPKMMLTNGVIRHYHVMVTNLQNTHTQYLNVPKTLQVQVSALPGFSYNCSVAAVTIAAGPSNFVIWSQKEQGNLATSFGIFGIL